MNINTANNHSVNQIQSLSAIESGANTDKQVIKKENNNINELQGNISLTGQVTSYISNLPEAQQKDIKEYLQSTQEAKANGTFDIKTSINEAPEAYNDLVDKFNLGDDKLNILSKGINENNSNSPTKSNLSGASFYMNIAESTAEDSSIFDTFISLFSSDTEEK